MNILGVSALYHDSAAALCADGEIAAAAQEERFTRKKADASIPVNAIRYCLSRAEGPVDAVVYYDNPLLTLDRWLNNCIGTSPCNEKIIDKSFSSIYANKLWIHELVKKAAGGLGEKGKLLVCEHHMSHAASAFYPSPFSHAAVLTVDGVGEWATTTIGVGDGENLRLLEQMNYPDSVGLLYSAFTYFCGFKVNVGEYKLMGLAPYGEPVYYKKIVDNLVDIKPDGSIVMNMEYFTYMRDPVMTGESFERLFGLKRRIPEDRLTKPYMDMAASVQKVTEEIILKMARHARALTGERSLALAGGVALNCVANGKLLREKIFDGIWVQPAAGDAGGALGAALYASHQVFGVPRRAAGGSDSQKGSYLGPQFSEQEIVSYLEENRYPYHRYQEPELFAEIAGQVAKDKVVGVFQGRMEFGPRALGGRSIIANPMSADMQSKLNLKIKFRESFRPFAPAVLEERLGDYFELETESPYMLLVAPVKRELCLEEAGRGEDEDILDIIRRRRSSIPAVTHVDYSARVQTVSRSGSPYFYRVIKEFEKLTGCGLVVNTSFNVRGEPIVCTPKDAYLCFMRTDMDVLVLENCILFKEEQRELKEDGDWREQYELD